MSAPTWEVRFDEKPHHTYTADDEAHARRWCENRCYFAKETGEVLRNGVVVARRTAIVNGRHAWDRAAGEHERPSPSARRREAEEHARDHYAELLCEDP